MKEVVGEMISKVLNEIMLEKYIEQKEIEVEDLYPLYTDDYDII